MQFISDHLVTILMTAAIPLVLYLFKTLFDAKYIQKQEREAQIDVNENLDFFINKANEYTTNADEKDVLRLMLKNVKELREYYVLSKQQYRNSFSATLVMSFLGFALLAAGIGLAYTGNQSVVSHTTISGSIIEIVAALFFWIHRKAIQQINHYHSSLLKTEKYLTAIQLVDKVSQENRDKIYSYIITRIISDGIVPNDVNILENQP